MINNICLEGRLVTPFKEINKDNTNFGVAVFVAQINKKNKFISLLIFSANAYLYDKAQKRLLEENKGKRLCVSGKIAFDSMENLQIVASDIEFIDKFVDSKTLNENKVVFDENEVP